MNKVIIPVDFSETALNAARFTARMLAGKKDTLVILYHHYDHEDDFDVVKNFMESLKKDLLLRGDTAVEYEMEMGGNLIDNLELLAQSRKATLIAMGITGKSAFEQAVVGSKTLELADRKICPVMIIPPKAVFSAIKNVAFASDFNNVEDSTPAAQINAVLDMFNPNLHIVNVIPENNVSVTDEHKQGKDEFTAIFQNHSPEFYFIVMNDFHQALDNFVKDHNIDLLLTIPRHHSNESGLLRSTNTKKLAYHSSIPILATHK